MTTEQKPKGYQANDQAILELTGIEPDERHFIPLTEQRLLLKDAQDPHLEGSEAVEILISQHLRQVYTYVEMDAVKSRLDLDDAEVMQIGYLAIIEAAMEANPDGKQVNSNLVNSIGRHMGKLLIGSKLLPNISDFGNALQLPKEEEDFADNIQPMEPEKAAEQSLSVQDRTIPVPSIENEVWPRLAGLTIRECLENLSYREEELMKMLFGLESKNGEEKTLNEAGQTFSVSTERVRQIRETTLRVLRRDARGYLDPNILDGHINEGLRSPARVRTRVQQESLLEEERMVRHRALQQARNQAWLEELAAKKSKVTTPRTGHLNSLLNKRHGWRNYLKGNKRAKLFL